MEYFTPEQQAILSAIYSKVLEKKLTQSELDQLYIDEKTIINCERKKGNNCFHKLITFWGHYLTGKPFIYFPG